MTIPDYQTVMLPVLRAVANGAVRVSHTVEKMADEFGLSVDVRAELLPSGRHRQKHRDLPLQSNAKSTFLLPVMTAIERNSL